MWEFFDVEENATSDEAGFQKNKSLKREVGPSPACALRCPASP
jgi:hypothetical protein